MRTTVGNEGSADEGFWVNLERYSLTEVGRLDLKSLDDLDQLLAMLLNLVFFHILHIFDVLQDAMYVLSARLYADTVSPADFKVAYSSSIAFADVQQPVEDVIVVLSVYNDFVCAIEHWGGFGVYEAAGAEERCTSRSSSGSVAAINQTFLT